MGHTKYEQVKSIHNLAVDTHDANKLREILPLLNSWEINCRNKDGELLWTNLSVPTSVEESITIGLRYRKRGGTLTEDIFELQAQALGKVNPNYKDRYQKLRPEYLGHHKQQGIDGCSFTSVNTCSLYCGEKSGS